MDSDSRRFRRRPAACRQRKSTSMPSTIDVHLGSRQAVIAAEFKKHRARARSAWALGGCGAEIGRPRNRACRSARRSCSALAPPRLRAGAAPQIGDRARGAGHRNPDRRVVVAALERSRAVDSDARSSAFVPPRRRPSRRSVRDSAAEQSPELGGAAMAENESRLRSVRASAGEDGRHPAALLREARVADRVDASGGRGAGARPIRTVDRRPVEIPHVVSCRAVATTPCCRAAIVGPPIAIPCWRLLLAHTRD